LNKSEYACCDGLQVVRAVRDELIGRAVGVQASDA
jgi:hypothetical protein